MIISMLGKEQAFAAPTTVQSIIAAMAPEYEKTALGCFCGGKALELNEPVSESCSLHPITFQNEEGRRIYERSLRFVLLLALHRVLPESDIRIEHSIGYGVYMRLLDRDADQQIVDALQAEMEAIVQEDLPFVRERWSRDRAIQYFLQTGHEDKTRLLAYRPYDYFPMYLCGGIAEYFYGVMLPSTGYVSAFRLRLQGTGMVLQMPSPKDPARPAPFVSRPKFLDCFAQSNRWCDILNVMNASDLNDLTVCGELPQFIRVNEALHDQSIGDIAQGVFQRKAKAVFVAGPSSSGKTTFSNRLCIHLRVLGLKPVLVSLDDFYLDRDLLPLEENGKPDLEALSALDVELLRSCVAGLLRGESVMMPQFDFTVSKRKEKMYPLKLQEDTVLVMEGIHGLNPALHAA